METVSHNESYAHGSNGEKQTVLRHRTHEHSLRRHFAVQQFSGCVSYGLFNSLFLPEKVHSYLSCKRLYKCLLTAH